MTDHKVSALTAVTTIADADEYLVARSGQSYKITGASLKSATGGAVPFVGASAPSSPTDGELWWDTDDATEVGGSSTSVSATVTTDPATFTVSHTFDLGRVATAYISATLTAFNPDGETPGFSAGQILADIYSITHDRDAGFAEARPVGVLTATSGAGNNTWMRDNPYDGDGSDLPLLTHEQTGIVARYVKVTARIIDGNSFDVYAGANNPGATFRLDVEYV